MKNLIPILLLLALSCKPVQPTTFTVNETLTMKTDDCPNKGKCSIELIPNKSLNFKTDAFGIGYPVISEGEKTIFKYTYKKNLVANTQDSDYTEIVYAELDKTVSPVSLTDEDMQNIKLHFGRLCYCKGETGYYPIKKGAFNITNQDKNSLNFDIEFTVKKVPQIVSKISEIISLNSKESN